MNVCIVNFSGRKNGNCHDIAKLVEQLLVNDHKVKILEMYDLSITPCGKCEYECFYENKSCPYNEDDIDQIYTSIHTSDEAYYIIPNYSDYPNAYFFIFNERSQRIFTNRPPDYYEQYLQVKRKFIVVSSTEEDNFKHILKDQIPETTEPDILFLATKTLNLSAIRDKLIESEQARQMIAEFIK